MNKAMRAPLDDLFLFLDGSPTMFHATVSIIGRLEKAGFERLDEGDEWSLKSGAGYFVVRNDSAVIAFRVGRKSPWESGFMMAGAHTDSPLLKIKPESESMGKNVVRVATEIYGGPIVATWLDRNLAVAGRVMVKGKKGWEARAVDTGRAVAIVPNLAIHMNREVNKGFEYNPQNHLQAVLCADAKGGDGWQVLKALLAETLGVPVTAVGEMDLYLYDPQPAVRFGRDDELYSSGRIDNLASCHAILAAFLDSKPGDATAVALFYDNEEIGSRTPMGADSGFTATVLERIVMAHDAGREEFHRALAKSFLVSCDAAHAIHPNFPEKHDPAYAPLMNGGPVIKVSAGFKYATTAVTAERFRELCRRAGVPCQKIANRSDVPSGSTIGPMTTAALSVPGVDVGVPMWAMHSVRETAGTRDHLSLIAALKELYR
ncbi:MAG TPA: M18 family aminopeptidase [bacterium]|nr:M18 family aminopeptidase [bacterium]